MAGLKWVAGWLGAFSSRRVAGLLLSVGLCATASCVNVSAESAASDPGFGVGGSFSNPGVVSGIGGSEPSCIPASTASPVFADQVFSSRVLFARELYAWTTDEQALALRSDQALFTQNAGTGAPFTLLRALASATADESQLAQELSAAFRMGRYAWPEPWPTRMGSPGQDPGGQLVRILLKPEAWLAIIANGSVSVFDAQQQFVSPTAALAHPERIGAIYFDSSLLAPGNCIGGGTGQRQFLLGNLAMVDEWSLGTQQMADRLRTNIEQLTRFLNNIRSCPVTSDAVTWSQAVSCSWQAQLNQGEAGASGFDPGSAAGAAGAAGLPPAAAGASAAGAGFDPAHLGSLSGTNTEEFAYEQALANSKRKLLGGASANCGYHRDAAGGSVRARPIGRHTGESVMHCTSRVVGVSKLLISCCALAACNADFSGLSSSPPTAANGSAPGPGFSGGPAGPLLDAKAVTAKSATPVVGGTLLVTRDGKTIAAADPERDAVFLVNAESHAVTPIPLQAGDEPGRVAEGADGTLYVALRRGGAVVALDIDSGSIIRRAAVCASPRGIAYDAKSTSLYVACRSGLLLTLDSNDLSTQRSVTLDPDLRDVLVRDHDLVVTRYLSAEVLLVGSDGTVSRRATPEPSPGCGTATVLSRALALPSGEIALAHQISSDDTVNVTNGGYGFSSCGGGLVTRAVSKVNVDVASDTPITSVFGESSNTVEYVHSAMTFQSLIVPSAGPLDIAIDAAGNQLAMIALDSSLQASSSGGKVGVGPSVGSPAAPAVLLSSMLGASLWLAPLNNGAASPGNITTASLSVAIKGQPVAVAFNAGSYIVQSREPASLQFQNGTSVALSSESHADTGHFMFHMDTGIGISCSSCHPEGGEDGHVWHFPSGLRRTLPVEGGVLERAPFHWDGTLADMNALFSEVMVKRMNLQATVSDQQVAALGAFLEQLPELAPSDGLDYAAVTRGEALFRRTDVGCAVCHSGAQYTNNALSDVGTGGQFVTPSLLGVGLRSPIFHDGCAKSVSERFGPCGGSEHGKASLLSADEQADLIAFLRSL